MTALTIDEFEKLPRFRLWDRTKAVAEDIRCKCGSSAFIELAPEKVGCANTKCRNIFGAIGLK